MAVLNIYLKSWVKEEEGFNKALSYCVGKLTSYFVDCVKKTDNRLFNAVKVTLNPHSSMVGEMDLLIYIVANGENSLMKTKSTPSPNAAGRTDSFRDGILSEVFANKAMNDGKFLGLLGGPFADVPKQGVALANLAFHELAHNKWYGLPDADKRRFNLSERSGATHKMGGLMSDFPDGYGNMGITPHNIEVMASMIQYPVRQAKNIAPYYF